MKLLNLLKNPFCIISLQFSLWLFFMYIKMSKNLSDKYYQENKERLQKKAWEGYQNLSDDEKQKLPEYRKKYYRIGRKWYTFPTVWYSN